MNCVIEYMREKGIPITRSNYLELAYMGKPPATLDPEEEGELESALETVDGENEY